MASVTKAYSLCGTLDEAAELRTEIAFFSAIRAALVKHGNVGKKLTEDEKNSALKQILDNAIRAEMTSSRSPVWTSRTLACFQTSSWRTCAKRR